MNTGKVATMLALAAVLAGGLTACSTDEPTPVSFTRVAGNYVSANPGAPVTSGVPQAPTGVVVRGNAVAAQAVATAGLPQGTPTSTVKNVTVVYPAPPRINGIRQAPVPRRQQSTNTGPSWRQETPYEYDYDDRNDRANYVTPYLSICLTGSYRGVTPNLLDRAGSCWYVFGQQVGVAPWYPTDRDDPPWHSETWPVAWWEREWHQDRPVYWEYPDQWRGDRPQPVIYGDSSVRANWYRERAAAQDAAERRARDDWQWQRRVVRGPDVKEQAVVQRALVAKQANEGVQNYTASASTVSGVTGVESQGVTTTVAQVPTDAAGNPLSGTTTTTVPGGASVAPGSSVPPLPTGTTTTTDGTTPPAPGVTPSETPGVPSAEPPVVVPSSSAAPTPSAQAPAAVPSSEVVPTPETTTTTSETPAPTSETTTTGAETSTDGAPTSSSVCTPEKAAQQECTLP